MNEQRYPTAPKTWIHQYDLCLSGPPPKGDHKQAKLAFSRSKNNVKVIVYTGDPSMVSERNKFGTIEGVLSPIDMSILIAMFRAIEAGQPVAVDEITIKQQVFANNKPTGEYKPSVAIKVKVDDQGLYFGLLNVRYDGAPKIRFSLAPEKTSNFRLGGEPANPATFAKVLAGGWAQVFTLMLQDCVLHYVAPEPKNKGGNSGSNGGGGQKYSNQGQISGGSSIDDDDIEF